MQRINHYVFNDTNKMLRKYLFKLLYNDDSKKIKANKFNDDTTYIYTSYETINVYFRMFWRMKYKMVVFRVVTCVILLFPPLKNGRRDISLIPPLWYSGFSSVLSETRGPPCKTRVLLGKQLWIML